MDPNEDLSDLPDLDDFTEQIDKLKGKKQKESDVDIGDYSQPKSEPLQQDLSKPLDPPKPKSYPGLKKGFFNQIPQAKSKPQTEIEEIKPDPQAKSKNKLEIPEVQKSMNMNNFLMNDQKTWLTPDLLNKISENPILIKLFTNPEYLNAITLMQKDPKGVMEKYGKNPEFMQIFQEFCKIMGTHFTDISKETPKKDPEAERIQKLMENDEEVKEILKDPQIQNLLQFLSQNQKVELNKLMEKNPILSQKINVLIKKGIINVQNC